MCGHGGIVFSCVCVPEAGRGGEEEEEEEAIALSVDVCAESALQLTLTKTSLGIFTELVQVCLPVATSTTHLPP